MPQATATATDPVTTTIETVVDPLWLEHCDSTDVFSRTYCGFWAVGIAYTTQLGWLLFEHGGETRPPERVPKAVLDAWIAGAKLPKRWHRLDRATAIRAWEAGVRFAGERWFENGDGPRYNLAIQLALFGAEKYA